MKLSIYDFIHRGYFPKELPPAFNAYHFAVEYEKVQKEWNVIQANPGARLSRNPVETEEDYQKRKKLYQIPISVPVVYSYSKGKLCRRNLSVLNPVNFLELATFIDTNITNIKSKAAMSVFSQSIPTYNTDILSRCYCPSSPNVMSMIMKKLECARNKRIEVKVDINQFYPSIYTHAITWAMVGKDKAKALWKQYGNKSIPYPSNAEEQMYNIGYRLDELIEHCQDKQTSGIPIGPDSSFIVGELIAGYIDNKISTKFQDVRGCRYYDDYTLYVSSREEAALLVKTIQCLLNEFDLSVNEGKIEVKEAPNPFLYDYAEKLAPFEFDSKKTESALIHYFNLLWKLCDQNPNKIVTIIKYGLRPLTTSALKIDASKRKLFESLLYKTALLEPSALNLIQQLLVNKNITPTKASLEELVCEIIKHHAPLCHHHEVAWALWFCKRYTLTIGIERVHEVLDMNDPICTLVILDYINNTITELKTDVTIANHIKNIEATSTPEDLFGENWILLYEGAVHNWLNTSVIVNANPYFKYLLTEGISFYDDNPAANYQSYDYIETLPYDNIPREMRKQAKDLRQKVFENIYDDLYGDFADNDDFTDFEVKKIKSTYKELIKDYGWEEKIFNKILSELFRREEPELKEYADEVIEWVKDMMSY